jgi:hypothetical protein
MKEQLILKTKDWIENWVIGLNLCPFAKSPFTHNKIKFLAYEGESIEEFSRVLWRELSFLADEPSDGIETTFLIHPQLGVNFENYLDLCEWANGHIKALELVGQIQIAEFHPHYQFASTLPDAPENFTNRSPFPMLHLLKEASITKAVDLYPNVEEIPQKNIDLLNQMGIDRIQKMLKDL